MNIRASSSPDSRLRSLLTLAIAFLPIVASWVHKVLIHRRQFYAFYFDPETIYFYEGGRLLHGIAPINIDNPGTPLQLLSACIELFLGDDPLRLDTFRVFAYTTCLAAKLAVAYVLLRTLLRRVPPLLQIVALWSFFLAPHALEYETVWSPEAWYFVVGGLLVAAIAVLVETPSRRHALLAGVVGGFAVALKLTFLAWIPATIIATFFSVRTRERLKMTAAVIAGEVLGFVIGTLPIVTRYGEIAERFSVLATSAGSDGRGGHQEVTVSLLAENLRRVAVHLPQWHVSLAAVVVVAIAILVVQRPRPERTRAAVLVVTAIIGILATYLLGSRHVQLRYFIPAGIGIVMLIAAIADERFISWRRGMQLVVSGAAAVLLLQALRIDATRNDERIVNTEMLRSRVHSIIAAQQVSDPVIVYAWHYPQPSFALRALAFAGRYYRRIEERYPRDGHYDIWARRWYLPHRARTWDFLVINAADVQQISPEVAAPVARVGEYFVLRRR